MGFTYSVSCLPHSQPAALGPFYDADD
eukprot:COSAG01_NODE_52903_length_343_cov_0.786885_2_plen_26_part_01